MRIVDVQTLFVRASQAEDYWGRQAWQGDYQENRQGGSADLSIGYPLRWRMRHRWTGTVDTVLVKVLTDDGIAGYGESKGVISGQAVKAHIDQTLRPAVLGADPFHTTVIWDRLAALMRGRGHLQGFHQEACAGIDIACWDIKGKAASRPVYDLLGGPYRAALPVYFSALPGLRDPKHQGQRDTLAGQTRAAIEQGFTAAKIAIGHGRVADLASVDTVRRAAGEDFAILVDALGGYSYTDALWLGQALADRGVGWFETPLPPEDIDGYVELSRRLPLLVANDFLWTSGLIKELIRSGGRVVVQPEVIKVGITECRRIAELADICGMPYAPHSSLGSALQYAATCHVGLAAANLVFSEYWAGPNPLGNDILRQPLRLADGHLHPPAGEGLGVEPDPERLKAYVADGSWQD